MRTITACAVAGAAVTMLGCADATDIPPVVTPVATQTSAPPPPPPPAQPTAVGADTAAAESAEGAAADAERVKAEAGVGKRGRDYGGGIVTEVVGTARFTVEQRTVFDIQIPKAMQLFRATNDRLPKSDEEFMREIIKANFISLPELPQGERYVYDPKLGELMVERPGR